MPHLTCPLLIHFLDMPHLSCPLLTLLLGMPHLTCPLLTLFLGMPLQDPPPHPVQEPETIVITIPAAAMRNNKYDFPNAARFEILAAQGKAVLGGTMLEDISESELRTGA